MTERGRLCVSKNERGEDVRIKKAKDTRERQRQRGVRVGKSKITKSLSEEEASVIKDY